MKVLDKKIIDGILEKFRVDNKLELIKTLKYEPDCFIYLFNNESGGNYILICRDLVQDDSEAEKRILKNELGIEILDRIKTKANDYWLRISDLDDFEYVFSLNRVSMKSV